MTPSAPLALARRDLLKGAGALVVGFGFSGTLSVMAQTAPGGAVKPPLAADQLDSWIAVHQDGGISAFFGKMDMGQGVDVAIAQIVAEELDVDVRRVSVVMGDTASSLNQGGASGSTGVQKGGIALRNAAAEARRVLVEMAASRLGVPVATLAVTDGVVGDGDEADLLWRADRRALLRRRAAVERQDRQRSRGDRQGQAQAAGAVQDRRPVGAAQRHRRQGLRPPRLRHRHQDPRHAARTDDPARRRRHRAGRGRRSLGRAASPASRWFGRRASSVSSRRRNGTRSARRRPLKVTWSEAKPAFIPIGRALRPHPQRAGRQARGRGRSGRDRSRLRRRRAASSRRSTNGPSSRMPAWVRPAPSSMRSRTRSRSGPARRSRTTPGTASRSSSACRRRRSTASGSPAPAPTAATMPATRRWTRRVLSQAVGKPVRLQYMRYEGHGWDPKGPASVHRCRAALDAEGKVLAYHFESKGFSRVDTDTNEADPRHSLAGHAPRPAAQSAAGFRRAGENPTPSPTSAWPGRRSRRCSTAPRRCAPRICAIPWARRSISPANPSSTSLPRRPRPIPSSSACNI